MVSWGPSWNLPLLLTVLHFTGPRSQEAVVPSPTATLVLFGVSARAVLPGMASPPTPTPLSHIYSPRLAQVSSALWLPSGLRLAATQAGRALGDRRLHPMGGLVCWSVYLSIYYLSIIYLSVCLYIYYLSISIYLSIYLSIIYLSIFFRAAPKAYRSSQARG